jgi:hypothetical protein
MAQMENLWPLSALEARRACTQSLLKPMRTGEFGELISAQAHQPVARRTLEQHDR